MAVVQANQVLEDQSQIESNGTVFSLYVVEERIGDHSTRPFCSHCKSVGWGHHFVCKRRFPFFIQPYGDKQALKDHDHDYNLELNDSQILHGLIHCNGFCNLISINNLQLGSSVSLTEIDVMNLWDSLCNSLKTRKVSVADFKLERSVELRLIYGVAFKCSWFGNWGYKFGKTEDKYRKAVRFLAGTFVGVYDGHGGPDVARYVCNNLFRKFQGLLYIDGIKF